MPRKDKCFSECRGLKPNDCVVTEDKDTCKMTNGSRYKYCRLSRKYVMNKDCNITQKLKHNRSVKENSPIKENTPIKPSSPTSQSKTRKNIAARKIIGKFMLATAAQRRAHFLKTVCSDSGACIAFGTESKKIKDFFDGFTTFEHVDPPIKRIGVPSRNGFVNEIKYSRNEYTAYAILKSSVKPSADNLVYEYLVGQYLNRQSLKFPCFLETYGLFYYNNSDQWSHVKNTEVITTNVLKNSLTYQPTVNYAVACQLSKLACILIQHLKNAETLANKMTNVLHKHNFIRNDLLNILYQVYMPLAFLQNEFTHYDLHCSNILIYEPIKNKYIHYHYHLSNGEIVDFKSQYIAKIIDYGRCYFDDDKTKINSVKIVKEICFTNGCFPHCGYGAGFRTSARELKPNNYYTSIMYPNQSHDLRALNIMKSYIKPGNIFAYKPLNDFIQKVVYGQGITGEKVYYGTKPNTKSGSPKYLTINNVNDASNELKRLIKDPVVIQHNNNVYDNKEKIGDLHIYTDERNMKFIPFTL